MEQAKEKNGSSLKLLTEHCDKPQVKPPLVIDSFASSTADLHDTVNDENSENGIFSSLLKWLFVFFFSFPFQYFSICPCLIPGRGVDALFHSSQ